MYMVQRRTAPPPGMVIVFPLLEVGDSFFLPPPVACGGGLWWSSPPPVACGGGVYVYMIDLLFIYVCMYICIHMKKWYICTIYDLKMCIYKYTYDI